MLPLLVDDAPAVSAPRSVIAATGEHSAWRSHWSLAIIMMIAVLWLYETPWAASDLIIAPDSVEYALAPAQLLETGRYAITLEGRELPSRYPPWFSSLVILPVYAVFGAEPGNAIFGITALAVAGIALAWLIGRRIAGQSGAILASIAVLALPGYTKWAKYVMSDVPSAVVMLAGWVLYLRLRTGSMRDVPAFLAAGITIAVASLFRPTFAAMALPFLWAALGPWRVMVFRITALGVPLAIGAGASLAYNAATFGSMFRNGYHLWAPVPNDYPHLVFSLSNIPTNLQVIWAGTSLPLVTAIAVVLAAAVWFTRQRVPARERQALRESFIFLALTTGPIVAFHLVYFFPTDRFFLPPLVGIAIIAGALAGRLLGRERERVVHLVLPALLVLAVSCTLISQPPIPNQRLAAESIKAHTPEDAVVISAIDPVYLGRMAAHGSARRIIPFSRRVEYACMLLAWKKVENLQSPPRDWGDIPSEALRRGGAVPAIAFVASEQIHALETAARAGTRVYLESIALEPQDQPVVDQLRARFRFEQRAPFLFQLSPK